MRQIWPGVRQSGIIYETKSMIHKRKKINKKIFLKMWIYKTVWEIFAKHWWKQEIKYIRIKKEETNYSQIIKLSYDLPF